MKRLAIFLASMSIVTGCAPGTDWDRMSAVDGLTNDLRSQYGQVLLAQDLNRIKISCEHAGDSPAKHIHVQYDFGAFPIRTIDMPPSDCELGPAIKIEAWSTRYSSKQIYAYGRRQYTIAAVRPYLDAILADQIRDHL